MDKQIILVGILGNYLFWGAWFGGEPTLTLLAGTIVLMPAVLITIGDKLWQKLQLKKH